VRGSCQCLQELLLLRHDDVWLGTVPARCHYWTNSDQRITDLKTCRIIIAAGTATDFSCGELRIDDRTGNGRLQRTGLIEVLAQFPPGILQRWTGFTAGYKRHKCAGNSGLSLFG